MKNYNPYSFILTEERIEITEEIFQGRTHILKGILHPKEVNICKYLLIVTLYDVEKVNNCINKIMG